MELQNTLWVFRTVGGRLWFLNLEILEAQNSKRSLKFKIYEIWGKLQVPKFELEWGFRLLKGLYGTSLPTFYRKLSILQKSRNNLFYGAFVFFMKVESKVWRCWESYFRGRLLIFRRRGGDEGEPKSKKKNYFSLSSEIPKTSLLEVFFFHFRFQKKCILWKTFSEGGGIFGMETNSCENLPKGARLAPSRFFRCRITNKY